MVDAARNDWPGSQPPTCLITGAARGLGRAVAGELARRGAAVVVTSREPGAATRCAEEITSSHGVESQGLRLDITRPREVADAAQLVERRFGRLDVLINNAAAYVDWTEAATTADLSASRQVMETNLYGTWSVIQAFVPLLRRSDHPRIVNVASGAGSHGDMRYGLPARHGAAASYGVSKAAVLALTSTLAAELAETPLLVNAVDPDLTATWPGAEDMGARPVADSVDGVVWAATLPADGPRGGFFRDRRPHPW